MSYENKQQQKREHYEQMSQTLQAKSNEASQQAVKMASVIPMGQPILRDHYSCKTAVNYRAKIDNSMRKSIELEEKAEYYAQKAESVGTGGISSLDENAVEKLKLQLSEREAQQESYKLHNKKVKKEGQGQAIEGFTLTNNNANIKRIKNRIAFLEKLSIRGEKEIAYKGFTYKEQDNRIMFIFDGKPSEHVRTLLKSHGLKWSPRLTAWTRILTSNALFTVKYLLLELNKECN